MPNLVTQAIVDINRRSESRKRKRCEKEIKMCFWQLFLEHTSKRAIALAQTHERQCDQIARFLAQYLAIFSDEKILIICSIEVALNSLQWKVNFFPVINKALKITKDFNFLLECQNLATYLVTLLLSPTFDVNK